MMPRTRIQVRDKTPANSVACFAEYTGSGQLLVQQLWPSYEIDGFTGICSDESHAGPPYKSGGPLSILKIVKPTESLGTEKFYYPSFFGGLYDVVDFRPLLIDQCPRDIVELGDAERYGASAWRRFKPGRIGANMGQYLAEAKDLPRLLKFRAKSFRDIGNNYLNVQFGWAAFLRDLKSFFDLTGKICRRWDYLKRNNNRFKKRGGTYLEDSSTETVPLLSPPVTPMLSSWFYPNATITHTSTATVQVHRKIWFEALMRFFIPNIDSPYAAVLEAVRQFGLYPSPALVYELTPWSWLIDYFSNLGDVIDNLSDAQAAPNLVALYAYVMNTTIVTRTCRTHFDVLRVWNDNTSAFSLEFAFTQAWESKTRAEANPFGFSMTSEELSDYQLSILAAIGISRFPKIR